MNVLSLFDGMSCGHIALQRAGIKVDKYFASEIDKYAIQIAKKRYPDTIHVGDVKDVDGDFGEHKIDLLIGGSPCQGFSFAGKQLNFDDPRSKLFFEYVRLLKVCKPKYFLLENVRMKQESQDVISEMLGVKPIAINSNLVSAQNRYRLYWTNIPVDGQPEDKGIMLSDILLPDAQEPMLSNIYGGFKEKEPRVHFGKSVTIRTASGGGHIPSVCCAQRGKYVEGDSGETKQQFECRDDGKTNALTTVTKDNLVTKTGFVDRDKAHCLDANYYKGGNLKSYFDKHRRQLVFSGDYKDNFRKLHPVECERLQTVPDGYTEGVSNTQRYKMLGNGWTVDVIAYLFKNLEKEYGYDPRRKS